jgi:hypothetical protein
VLTETPPSLRFGTTATTYRTTKGEEWWTKVQSVFFVFSTNRTLVLLPLKQRRSRRSLRWMSFVCNESKNDERSGGSYGLGNIRASTHVERLESSLT